MSIYPWGRILFFILNATVQLCWIQLPMKLKSKSLLPTKINDGTIVYSFDFEIEIYVEDWM